MANVFLACPRHTISADERENVAYCDRIRANATESHGLCVDLVCSSVLTRNCNAHLRRALNDRAKHNYKWLAMQHDDVWAQHLWLDKAITIAEQHEADFLSVVVPIKNLTGKTSTAIAYSTAETGTRRSIALMQAQVRHPNFPDTFDIHAAADALERLPEPYRVANVPRISLWCNTGCMICRIDRDWDWTKVCFAMDDGLELVDGQYREYNFPEDWMFSQRVAVAGGKVMATRIIDLDHVDGEKHYRSTAVWGQPRDIG